MIGNSKKTTKKIYIRLQCSPNELSKLGNHSVNNLFSIKLYSLTVNVKTIVLAFINLNQISENVQEIRDLLLIISRAF